MLRLEIAILIFGDEHDYQLIQGVTLRWSVRIANSKLPCKQ